MKILITGGNGFLARNLTKYFKVASHEVLSPSREELNVTDRKAVSRFMNENKPDMIIHTATKGGRRDVIDTHDDFVDNTLMYENLRGYASQIPLILIGSGAEYDRRSSISNVKEEDVTKYYPIDPYGLSKNLITRRTLEYDTNIWILRLFGCFNEDENIGRFIKTSISNVKEGRPITVIQNQKMDFFYFTDLCYVIDSIILTKNVPKHINLVYPEKCSLLEIAEMIKDACPVPNATIQLMDTIQVRKPYTGNSDKLQALNLPLIGLKQGIQNTIDELWKR